MYCTKKKGNCPYSKRSRNAYPCTKCEEPKKQYPITCWDCRKYPCKGDKQSIRTCNEFKWD